MDVNMNITEILKNAFIFPSKNLETLSVYAILSLLSVAFIFEGIVTGILGIIDITNLVVGIVYIVIGIIFWLTTRRISIQCIKTGIDLEEMPDFNWLQSFGTGFSKVIITIYYFIIPAIIVVGIALFTNLIGGAMTLGQVIYAQAPALIMGSTTASDAIYNAAFHIILSLAITISLGLIIFLVFSFFQAMGEARLAHTGSLKNALNIVGAARDIKRIGVVRLFILSALIFVIVVIIETILAIIFDHLLVLSILTIVTTPYIALFGQRALGLLYSDIV
jgi:hypothetical protein